MKQSDDSSQWGHFTLGKTSSILYPNQFMKKPFNLWAEALLHLIHIKYLTLNISPTVISLNIKPRA